ncbi:hypothetical protein Hc94105_0085 [Helicobacter cinaedi]|uniref:hypothetical protein n=1 Tax=Helicobacter cinaedi TaxID=213 RepID=UPI001F3A8484|nr:hypothetical protein [Helicobacter cinaedi]BDB65906.1 hypothetical protein Hc94105_0085 [Helicobacter cinaedi]
MSSTQETFWEVYKIKSGIVLFVIFMLQVSMLQLLEILQKKSMNLTISLQMRQEHINME